MKKLLKTLAIVGLTFLGCLANSEAQFVQQSISFTLTVYNQTDSGVRTLRLSNKDIILNLAGTNMPGAHLWPLMLNSPSVDENGTIGAFLRVTDRKCGCGNHYRLV